MLYDPRHKYNPQKPDIFALDTLIAWLEKQPADGRYNYSNPNSCLLAQYFTDTTGEFSQVSRRNVSVGGTGWESLPKGWNRIAVGILLDHSWTYQAALKRAKRLRLMATVGSILSRIPQLLGLT